MFVSFEKLGIEELLIGLRAVASSDNRFTVKAQGLLSWYGSTGELTEAQKRFGSAMVWQWRKLKSKKKKSKSYYLYAIDDGVNVKLGYSSNPKSRLKALQTGHSSKLSVVWSLDVGDVKTIAEKAERKIHRYCAKYHKRGEWFARDCLLLVKQFELKRKIDRELLEERSEREIVLAAKERV